MWSAVMEAGSGGPWWTGRVFCFYSEKWDRIGWLWADKSCEEITKLVCEQSEWGCRKKGGSSRPVSQLMLVWDYRGSKQITPCGGKSGGALCGGKACSTFQRTGCGVWKKRRGANKDSRVWGQEMRRLAFLRDQKNRLEVGVSIRHGHGSVEWAVGPAHLESSTEVHMLSVFEGHWPREGINCIRLGEVVSGRG